MKNKDPLGFDAGLARLARYVPEAQAGEEETHRREPRIRITPATVAPRRRGFCLRRASRWLLRAGSSPKRQPTQQPAS